MNNLVRGFVAFLATAILVGPLAFTGRTQERVCPNVVAVGSWSSIAAPPFTDGGPALTAYAVDPYAPIVMLATNGTQLWQTFDGGCSWELSFSLDLLPRADQPVSAANSKITAIEFPERRSQPVVYLIVEEEVGPVIRPHVVRLATGDAQWKLLDTGLPQTTTGVDSLTVAPSNSDTLYLHVQSPQGAEIYGSNDGGDSWELRGSGAGTFGLAVDPFEQEKVWAYGSGGLFHSSDGARNLVKMDTVGQPVGMVDVSRLPGQPAQILAYEVETMSFSISRDGGATWWRIDGPGGIALSIAHGAGPGQVLVAQHDYVSMFVQPNLWFEVTPPYDQLDLQDLQGDRLPQSSVYGMTPNNIERFSGFDTSVDIDGFDIVGRDIDVGGAALAPAKKMLRLRVGRSRAVDYRMEIPEHPVPLDVFFLVDTSASMEPTIRGLRNGMQDIVNELAEARIDAQFGVGEYKDYPITGYGDNRTDDFAYRLNRAIGPADESLEEGLEALRASGGGDPPESQLTALYQAATGAGEPGCIDDGIGDVSACVPDGQGANFRKEALKVIVHMTDAEFHDGIQHPSPAFGEVSSTLRDKGIEHIALSVYGMDGDEGRGDLMRMTADVDTTAPPGGVDCDGNGSIDIAAGEPLLCDVADWDGSGYINLTPSILATLKAITRNVEVQMVAESGGLVVDALEPDGERLVDITDPSEMATTVTYTCPASLAKETTEIDLALLVAGVRAAEATATVKCLPIPAAVLGKRKQLPVLVPPAIAPLAVVIPITPPPPPPVPQTINAPQSVQALQGVVAPQEQEQVQTAMAYAQFKNDEAFALSARAQRPPPLPLYATALAMAMAFGVAMSPRRALARRRYR